MEGLLQKVMPGATGPSTPPTPMASPQAMSGAAAGDGETPNVTGEEQQEYERGLSACVKMLHGDAKSQMAIVERIDPTNPVGSLAEIIVMVITTVDDKIDLGEDTILPLAEELVDLVIEVATASGRVKSVSSKQAEQILGTATELLIDHYGADEESFQEVAGGLSADQEKELASQYQTSLSGEGAPA